MTNASQRVTDLPPWRLAAKWRPAWLVLVWLAGGAGAHAQALPPPGTARQLDPQPRPSIVIIVANDLGCGDLGSYGQKKIRTPNLDRLAQQGMRLTQCYAGGAADGASRAALLTGRHSGHGKVRGGTDVPLGAEDETLAKVLRAAGYRTGAIGEWGLGLPGSGGEPQQQGFEDWFGTYADRHAQDYYPTQLHRNDRIVPVPQNAGTTPQVYAPHFFTKVATNFLRINKYDPFLLYLAYPLPRANLALGTNGLQIPRTEPYAKESWPEPERRKAAMISRLDYDVGMIMRRLQDFGLEEKTIVIFTSDNGPHRDGGVDPEFFGSAGPWRGHKLEPLEGGLRVPLLVRWTGRIRAGSTSDVPCALWDLLPTVTGLAGLPAPAGLDGISLAPTLLGQPQVHQHEYLYWEIHGERTQQAVRHGDWKAIRRAPGAALELYALGKDPREEKDVAAEHPEVVARIERYLKGARTEAAAWPLRGGPGQAGGR